MSGANEVQPWMRQSHETQRAFHAFSLYRDLGANRSLDKAHAIAWLEKHPKADKDAPAPKAPRHWDKWSAAYQWVERVKAFDDHINQEVHRQFEEALIIRRKQTVIDEYDAAMKQLDLWQAEYEEAVKGGFDLKALNLLGRLRTILNAQRRLALGMPTTATDVTSAGEKLSANVLAVDDLAEVFKQIQQHKEVANHAGS